MQSSDINRLEQEHPGYIARVSKNYTWNFLVIMLDSAIFSFAVTMLSQDTIIPYFVSQLTAQKFFIGLVPALFYLGFYFPQLIGAYAVTGKPTRKRYILIIAITQRFAILIIALIAQFSGWLTNTHVLALLLVAFTIYSITYGLIIPAYSDFISKNIIRRRGLFYGTMSGLGGLIGFSASLLATYLLENYPFPINLRLLFWFGFGTSFISPFFIAAYREIPFPFSAPTETLGHFFRTIPQHIRGAPGFMRFMLVRALLNLGWMANSFYALYAMQKLLLSPGVLGIFTMVIILTQSVVGFLWGWLGDRFGFKLIYSIGAVLVVAMGILSLTAPGVWAFYLIALCIGNLYAINRTADSNMVFEIAPPSETSRFVGIANTFIAPVVTLSPLLGGVMISIFSHQALFGLVLVIGMASILLTILYMPDPRKRS